MSRQYDPQPHRQSQPPDAGPVEPKSPVAAAALSLTVCGMGHVYTGQPLVAASWFVTAAVLAVLLVHGVLVALLPVVWIASCIHAYLSAGEVNRRHHAGC